ncbi:transketolase family protein [Candidatus Calescamantes bacterium]|nr:transketolase family protein [Candidatus Calescamantes bacterium]
MYEKISARKVFGETLAEYGAINTEIVVLVADVSASVRTDYFANKFPERFFNIGIAEAGMVDVAVGLALGGMIPFVNTFAGLYLRAIEQIRTCVSYAQTNVKLIGGYAGLSDFKDGPTHHSIMDIATMRAMPNMTIVVPADITEIKKMIPLIAEYQGPVYMRISRAEMPVIFDEAHNIEIGRAVNISDGSDVSIIATGSMVARSLQAKEILSKEGISAKVINMHTIKPLDISAVKEASQTGAIVTVEEHSVIGGLGSAVTEALSDNSSVVIKRVGINDTFAETSLNYEELLDHYGMGVEDIVRTAKDTLNIKKEMRK